MTTTVNRGWLARQIKKGLVEVKCEFHYTDDYAYDAANKFGASAEWRKAAWCEPGERAPEGVIGFDSSDLSTSSGRAYVTAEGVTRLYVHSNLCYTVRVLPEQKPARKARAPKAKPANDDGAPSVAKAPAHIEFLAAMGVAS